MVITRTSSLSTSAALRMSNAGTPPPKSSKRLAVHPPKDDSPLSIDSIKTPTSRKRTKTSTPASAENRVLRPEQVAAVNQDEDYHDLGVPPSEFRPSATLTTGQCFHWMTVVHSDAVPGHASAWGSHDATEWLGVLRIAESDQSIVASVRETPDTTLYRTLYAPQDVDVGKLLHEYFQLAEPLEPLYRQWSLADPDRMARIADSIRGVRIVQQDPWECLVSFICSSNNNIPRITKMLYAIRHEYGERLLVVGDETLHSFPSFDTFRRDANETRLREIGLGYRAKYLMKTVDVLNSLGGEPYLMELRTESDPCVVQESLVQFAGVGQKVADCVALFSLCQCNAIPVDVHVWNIARRDYDAKGTLTDVKSITPTVYRQVGDLFRSRFPERAGWAHSLLFVAELPSFRPVLPADMIAEMDKFRRVEQERKEATKLARRAKQGQ